MLILRTSVLGPKVLGFPPFLSFTFYSISGIFFSVCGDAIYSRSSCSAVGINKGKESFEYDRVKLFIYAYVIDYCRQACYSITIY